MSETSEQARTRVLIIGFGVTGIAATHYFSAAGDRFELTTVEARDVAGGVWNTAAQYPAFRANNSRNTFELPDLRHEPGSFDDFPTQAQIGAYLQQYIEQFGLEKFVHFGARVEKLSRRREGQGPWLFDVEFSAPVNGSTRGTFDFVVAASGFTDRAHIPAELDGAKLERPLLHSSAVTAAAREDAKLVEGKRVVVIGGSKSAIDLAVWSVEQGASGVSMVSPTLHWSPPRYFGDDDPAKGKFNEEVLYARFAEWFLPVCTDTVAPLGGEAHPMLRFIHGTEQGRKLRAMFWGGVCKDIMAQMKIPEALRPKHDFVYDAPYLAIQHPDFFPHVNAGKIDVRLGRATSFDAGKVLVSEGEPLDCDIVLCATGFGSSLTYLSEDLSGALYSAEGQAQLFRNIYSPDIPQAVFISHQLNTNWMMTAAVAARWAVELAKGPDGALARSGVLANTEGMRAQIAKGLAFDREHGGRDRGMYCTGSSVHTYVEAIMSDLGVTDVRARYNGFEDEMMGPLLPGRYAGLATLEC